MKSFVFALLTFICLGRSVLAQYSVQLDLTEQKVYLLYHDRAVMESPVSSEGLATSRRPDPFASPTRISTMSPVFMAVLSIAQVEPWC